MYDEKYLVESEDSTNGDVAVAERKETYVAFVIDESGSMSGEEDAVISGFNEQLNIIKDQQDQGGDVFVGLYKFGTRPDSRPRRLFKDKRPNDLLPLSRKNYAPFGNTPMRDGVGMALLDLMQHDEEDDGVNRAFLVVVFTDGFENASKEWDAKQLAEKIEALQDTGRWTISYIGTNVDPTKFAETQYVPFSNIISTPTVAGGMAVASASMSNYFSATRGRGGTSTSNYVTPTPTPKKEVEKYDETYLKWPDDNS